MPPVQNRIGSYPSGPQPITGRGKASGAVRPTQLADENVRPSNRHRIESPACRMTRALELSQPHLRGTSARHAVRLTASGSAAVAAVSLGMAVSVNYGQY